MSAENPYKAVFQLPYATGLCPGHGVHILSGNAAAGNPFVSTSLKLESASKVAAKATFRWSTFRTSHDVDRAVNLQVKAAAEYKGVPGKANAKYLSELKVSNTQSSSVCDILFQPEAQLLVDRPRFSAEALELLEESPSEFRAQYGDYYVEGYTSQAWLAIIASHEASSKNDLDSFHLGLSAGVKDMGLEDGKTIDVKPVGKDAKAEPAAPKAADPVKETKPEAATEAGKENVPLVESAAPKEKPSTEEKEKASTETPGPAPASAPSSTDKGGVAPDDLSDDLHNAAVAQLGGGGKGNIKNWGAGGSTGLSSRTIDTKVKTDLSFEHYGVVGALQGGLDDIPKLISQFPEAAHPSPTIVHLRTFKSIDRRCLAPGQDEVRLLTKELAEARDELLSLSNDVINSTYPEISALRDIVTRTLRDLSKLDVDTPETREAWLASFRQLNTDIRKKQRRRVFMEHIEHHYGLDTFHNVGKIYRSYDNYKGVPWIAGATRDTINFLEPALGDNFILEELVEMHDVQNIDSSFWTFVPRKFNVEFATNGKFIIGYELRDNRSDGNSGSVTVSEVSRTKVAFTIDPAFERNAMWDFKVYAVDRTKYMSDHITGAKKLPEVPSLTAAEMEMLRALAAPRIGMY
ncbi:hypothetical protein JCM10207_007295 [Rhodosporidiobolus poonsookiae]